MFEIIKQLCQDNNISLSSLALQLGFSRNIFGELKAGRIKSLSADKISKIADYFDVSVDYLLGKSDIPEDDITFDDFSFALYNETKELTEGQKKELLNMARYMKAAIEKEEREEKEGKNNV